MNLIDENELQPKKDKKKLSLTIVSALIILLIILAILLFFYIQVLLKEMFKVRIDGVSNTEASRKVGLFDIKNGKVYTSIRDICKFVGYNDYGGGYKQFTEDRSKCYINNQKEVVSFASGSKEIIKYPLDEFDLPQKYEIDEEIILDGEKLYISPEGLEKAFNLTISYDEENNTVKINTLKYIANYYETTYSQVCLEKSEFDESVIFNNEKATLQNLFVTKDEATELFGVSSLNSNGELEQVISSRYAQVEYMEGTEDFIVTTEDKKVGVIGKDGTTKVKPDYDTINIIDRIVGLYLISSNNKQGVVDLEGNIIVHQDYDSIGLDEDSYDDFNITNRFLLLDNCIPVKLNNKWGLIDKTGETIAPVQYDGIGCSEVPETGEKNTNGVVVIPGIKGITIEVDQVMQEVGKDNKINTTIIKKYGIINANNGQLMINTELNSIYAITTQQVTRYYMSASNQVYDIIDFWNEHSTPSRENNNSSNTTNVNNNNLNTNNNENLNNNANSNNNENLNNNTNNADINNNTNSNNNSSNNEGNNREVNSGNTTA